MADSLGRARDLLAMNERVFGVMGVWPLKPSYVKFAIWFVYHVVIVSATMLDLLEVYGDLDLMIVNITENAWNFMVFPKMFIMRFSSIMKKLTNQMINDIDEKTFDSAEERELYLSYIDIATHFFKLWIVLAILATAAFHIKPLEIFFATDAKNKSEPLPRAYRTQVFFELNEVTFWFLWIYQIPMIYILTFLVATIAYLFTLILHVCGLMSILTLRIKKIDPTASTKSFKIVIHDIVKRHRHILELVDDINDAFKVVLLEELLVCTLLIGLTAYGLILNLERSGPSAILPSVLESVGVISLTYGYCFAGEYLITESRNLNESFYLCKWYEMPDSVKKQLIICMIGSCKPIQLLGGGFYIFSLENFTSIVKTGAGYISMLRAVI